MEDQPEHPYRFSVRTRHPRKPRELVLAQQKHRERGTWEVIGNVKPGDDVEVARELARLRFEKDRLERLIAKERGDRTTADGDIYDAIAGIPTDGFSPEQTYAVHQTADDSQGPSASTLTVAHIAQIAPLYVADGVAAGYKLQWRVVAKLFRVQNVTLYDVTAGTAEGNYSIADYATRDLTTWYVGAWTDNLDVVDHVYELRAEGNLAAAWTIRDAIVQMRWVPLNYDVSGIDGSVATTAAAVSYAGSATISATDVEGALDELDTEKAPLAAPAFTGNATATTQTAGNSSTRVATTAFVTGAISDHVGLADPHTQYALDTDLTAKANLASPTFTGDPKAPTPTVGDNDTSIATTAFVTAAVAAVAYPPALLEIVFLNFR